MGHGRALRGRGPFGTIQLSKADYRPSKDRGRQKFCSAQPHQVYRRVCRLSISDVRLGCSCPHPRELFVTMEFWDYPGFTGIMRVSNGK